MAARCTTSGAVKSGSPICEVDHVAPLRAQCIGLFDQLHHVKRADVGEAFGGGGAMAWRAIDAWRLGRDCSAACVWHVVAVLSARGWLGPGRRAGSCAGVGLRPTGRVGPTRRGHANPRRAPGAYPTSSSPAKSPARRPGPSHKQRDAAIAKARVRAALGFAIDGCARKRSVVARSNAPSARLDCCGGKALGGGRRFCLRRRGGYEARASLGLAGP